MNLRITAIASAILCLAGAATALYNPNPNQIVAERDGVRVVMGGGDGVVMTVDGIPFVNKSTLFCVKENWNGRWFGYQDDRKAVSRSTHEKTADGGDLFTVRLRSGDNVFQATQTLELLPGRVVRIGTEALITTSAVAMLEHQIGGMNPAWLAGRTFRISGKDARTSYTVAPTVARQAEMLDAAVAAYFDHMTIDTRMGPLEIIAKGDAKPVILDYRAHKWSQLTPHYWIGILETKMTKDKPLQYSIEFRFPPPRSLGGAETDLKAEAKPATAPKVLVAGEDEDRVFPTPKKIAWSDKNFALNAKTTVRVEAEGELAKAAEPALAGLKNYLKHGFDLTLARSEKKSDNQIVFVCRPGAVDVAKDNDEQYTVKADDTVVVCAANTTAGLMNAVKTLQQLVRAKDGKVFLRGCTVEDYPAMPYRGIHFFSGKDARELQLKMIRDVLGALKINNIVYQCEYVMWDATSKVHHAEYGMTKEDARAVVEECERQGIEITPLINTFGHSEWLIANDVYRHLADNPEEPYAYNPSDPEVYKLTDKIHEEVLEFFKPRVLHIGHDEITMEGFPHREENKKIGATELIMRDIMHHYDFLKARGVRTMLWGDMFLGPGEALDAALAGDVETAKARRAALPKDVIIADWHYDPNPVETFTSLKVLNDAGFDVLACPWFDPVNVVNFTRAAKLRHDATRHLTGEPGTRKGKTLGILGTTWAGYSFGQASFDENQDQYSAYFLAAEAAWTGAEKPFEEMGLDYRAEFARIWSGSYLPRGERDGWTIDLTSVATFPASADKNGDWLGHRASGAMENLPVGKARLGRFSYQIAGEKGSPRAMLLAARMNPEGDWPRSVTIPVDRPAAAIAFAAAATLPGPATPPIAHTTVTFDDGTTQSFAWKLGQTVFAVDDTRASATSPVIWKDTPGDSMHKALHQYVWRNPDPKKKVKSVRFDTTAQASGLMLFGMSGVLPD